MRCSISGLCLLACCAACLPHRVFSSTIAEAASCCRRTLVNSPPGVSGHGPSAFVRASLGAGRRPRQCRQISSCSSSITSVVRRHRVALLRAHSSEAVAHNAGTKAHKQKQQHPRPLSSSLPWTRTAVTAVVIELQRAADTETLAVYGKLHRLLGMTKSRQLLGLEAVATLTSLNYIVLHLRDGMPNLYNDKKRSQEEEANSCDSGGGGARLALGDRCWDICGIGQGGPTMDSAMRRAGKERERLVADLHQLQREIERVVKINSVSEVLSMELATSARPQKKKQGLSGALLRSTAKHSGRNLQRLYAPIRAAGALSQTSPSSFSPSFSKSPNTESSTCNNPLLGVGLGALLSRENCNTILREAQENDDGWAPWDGDLGKGATATTLQDLPLSRALWAGNAGNAVRARIADMYGVPQGSVAVDASGVFVCKIDMVIDGGARGGGDYGDGERGETPQGGGGKGGQSTRAHRQIDLKQQQQQQQQQVEQRRISVSAAEFRRSKSLVTFSVVLSAEKGAQQQSSWAVCFEQREECVRPSGQGSGVIFSGKLRHASVKTFGDNDDSAHEHPPVFLLRGFASIIHPSVLRESAWWQWGSPAWHVDAPWVKDQQILDRIWIADGGDGAESPGVSAEATGEDPPTSPSAAAAAAAAAAEASGGFYLKRMNSTLAHRYYRQGLGGMEIPVVDSLGRPVIDLVEDGGGLLSYLSSWLPGIRSDKAGEVTLKAVLRKRFPWDQRRQVGKAGLSTRTGASPRMDAALQKLFGASSPAGLAAAAGEGGARLAEGSLVDVPVPPIKYVFVDPRYRGLGIGRRLFLEAMRSLASRGFRFAVIVVEDNGSGGLFGFYEDMGFVRAEEVLGLPRAMIAPIPPPEEM